MTRHKTKVIRCGHLVVYCCHGSRLRAIEERQKRIEDLLTTIHGVVNQFRDNAVSEIPKKDWFTPGELAKLLGKRPYTVREWCRLGRINAQKRRTGRGDADEWEISAEEIERYKNHGLLPIPSR